MVLAPNPAPAEQVGAGLAGRIRAQRFHFQGRQVPPEGAPSRTPLRGLFFYQRNTDHEDI